MEPVHVDLPTAIERISDLHHQACHDLAAAVRRGDANTTAVLCAQVTVLRAALAALTSGNTEVVGDRPIENAVGEATRAAAKYIGAWVINDALDAADDVENALTDV